MTKINLNKVISRKKSAQQGLQADATSSLFIQGVFGTLRLSLSEDSVGAA